MPADRQPNDITSPGAMTRYRAGMEATLSAHIERDLRIFFAVVKVEALIGYRTDKAAPAQPWIEQQWNDLVVEPVLELLGPDEEDRALALRFLNGGKVPEQVYTSVFNIMTVALEEQMSHEQLRRVLADALNPNSPNVEVIVAALGLSPRGWRWGSIIGGVVIGIATAIAGRRIVKAARGRNMTHLRWITRRDDKVRPTHAAADGQTVPMEEPFIVGGEALMFPGDPDGSPGETYNCRCILVSVKS